MRARSAHLMAAAALVAVFAAAVYANSLANGFVMDDRYNVVENEAIRRLDRIPALFANRVGRGALRNIDQQINRRYWRPLTLASYAFDYRVWRLESLGYHLGNIALHALVSVLLLLLFSRLGLSLVGAAAGALVFALHPVHTEVVNLITYRAELLAAAFVAAALLFHAAHARGWGHDLVLLPLLYAAGLASKETAVTLPGWLLLLDLARGRSDDEAWRSRMALRYALLGAVLVGYLMLRRILLEPSGIDFFAGLPADLRLLSVAKIYRHYLQLLVVPWPLLAFYDWTALPPASGWADWQALAGLFLALATLVGAGLLWRRARLASLGLLWWACGLIPVLHFVPLPVGAAERFLYLPSVGVCLAFGYAVGALWERRWVASGAGPLRWRGGLIVAGAVLLSLMALGTLLRNRDWRSDITLQLQATRDYPGSFSAHYNLGKLYLERGAAGRAVASFERANTIMPNIEANVLRLADALIASCRRARALAILDAAIAEHGKTPQLARLQQMALRRRCHSSQAGAGRQGAQIRARATN